MDGTLRKPLTRNQSLVLGILKTAEQPLTAYAVLDRLRNQGLKAPPQIYRALENLMDRHLVHRIESLNAFVACALPHSHSDEFETKTVFLVCGECGRAEEIDAPSVMTELARVSDQQSFTVDRLTIEMRGNCIKCADGLSGSRVGAEGTSSG